VSASPLKHNCRVTGLELCFRTVGEPPSILKCAHGLPLGAHDLNGREYCIVCHWDHHERRRTDSLMYREWPILERRTGITEHNPQGVKSLTAPFGVERFISQRDFRPDVWPVLSFLDEDVRDLKDRKAPPEHLAILGTKVLRSLEDIETDCTPVVAKETRWGRPTTDEVPAEWRESWWRESWQCGPWKRKPSKPDWVAPSFTVIPILDHSQPPCRVLTNYCPNCVDEFGIKGLYVTQHHVCIAECAA